MRRLNNKGMTLTELLVSITMLSVAMILMYGLLSNVQKKKNEFTAKADILIPIADIEESFQDIVMGPCDYGRNKVTEVSVTGPTSNKVTITYDSNNYNVEIADGNKIKIYKGDNAANPDFAKTLEQSCSFKNLVANDNKYVIIIKCGEDYIKLPMYFKTT